VHSAYIADRKHMRRSSEGLISHITDHFVSEKILLPPPAAPNPANESTQNQHLKKKTFHNKKRRRMNNDTWPVVKFGPLYPTFRKEKMPDGSTKIFLKNHDEWRIWIRWEEPFSDGSYWSAEKIGPLKNNEATKRAFKKKKIWPFPSSKDEKSKTKSILLKKRGGGENNSVPNNSVGLPNINGCYFEAKHTKDSKDFACSTLSLSDLSRAFFSKKSTLGAGPNFRNHRIIR
jgi:hypothetical protein